jgi:hypothetical protein
MWNVNAAQVRITSPLFGKPSYEEVQPPKHRPPNILILRYIARCVAKKFDLEDTVLDLFRRFTAEPQKVISFSNFELRNPMPAIALEGTVRNITFDNCSPQNFGQLMNWIMLTQNRFTTIDFWNYDNAIFKETPLARWQSMFGGLSCNMTASKDWSLLRHWRGHDKQWTAGRIRKFNRRNEGYLQHDNEIKNTPSMSQR